jgi:hypothetical protein
VSEREGPGERVPDVPHASGVGETKHGEPRAIEQDVDDGELATVEIAVTAVPRGDDELPSRTPPNRGRPG